MSIMAKERQVKSRAKIKADPELYQAQVLKDREKKKRQRAALREKESEQQLQEHQLKEHYALRTTIKKVNETNKQHKKGDTVSLMASIRKSH